MTWQMPCTRCTCRRGGRSPGPGGPSFGGYKETGHVLGRVPGYLPHQYVSRRNQSLLCLASWHSFRSVHFPPLSSCPPDARYASVLLMTDTCQADTMHSQVGAPPSPPNPVNSLHTLQSAALSSSGLPLKHCHCQGPQRTPHVQASSPSPLSCAAPLASLQLRSPGILSPPLVHCQGCQSTLHSIPPLLCIPGLPAAPLSRDPGHCKQRQGGELLLLPPGHGRKFQE